MDVLYRERPGTCLKFFTPGRLLREGIKRLGVVDDAVDPEFFPVIATGAAVPVSALVCTTANQDKRVQRNVALSAPHAGVDEAAVVLEDRVRILLEPVVATPHVLKGKRCKKLLEPVSLDDPELFLDELECSAFRFLAAHHDGHALVDGEHVGKLTSLDVIHIVGVGPIEVHTGDHLNHLARNIHLSQAFHRLF